jgi:hypothetical protein
MVGTANEPQNSGQLSEEDQQRCIGVVRQYKDQWSQNRLILMQRCSENMEFFKGNQYISFGPGTAQFSDAFDWVGFGGGNGHAEDADDTDLYRYCNNFYQMLATGFVAALCPQVPKSKWMPRDADQLADTTTAKAAQTLIDIVEQQNGEASLLKAQLLYFWAMGAAFRHTRYLVSEERWGTKPEPIFNATETEIMPARMHCHGCGTDSSPDATGITPAVGNLACPNCGAGMGEDSFYPAVSGPVVRQVGTQEVPQGMVAQDLYSPLEIDVDPTAQKLRQTPILNLEVEVHVGALRAAYPGMYDQIQASATSELSANGTIDRIARQQTYSQTDGQISILNDQKPTLSRTWIQPWAWDIENDKAFGDRMRAMFPSGMLLVSTGQTFLNAREASLTKEWTWAGTHEKFGMYPPTPGDVVVPFQKKYNDLSNILQEGIDRGFCGLLLANEDLIGSKAFQGKPLLPGILNPVKLKKTGPPGSQRLQDALWQFEIELKIQEAMEYQKNQAFNAQMFAGVPPQLYGGEGDPSIETFGGQQQQLNTALGKLNIYWENLKDEHAEADMLAVNCAKDNLTEDMRKVVEDQGSEFRNEYVKLDDLQGSVRAYSDTDQGLPVTAAELRQRWMDLLNAAEKNPVAQAVFDDPENMEQAAASIGVPGMVVPGQAMRVKVRQIIAQLLQAEPIPQMDPQTGQPTGVMLPSIMPKQTDDFDVARKTVKQYAQKNFDLEDEVPDGWANMMAYYTQLVAMQTADLAQQAQQQGTAVGAGKVAATPPPPPPPQLSPDQANELAMIRRASGPAIAQLMQIGAMPALPPGESVQGQVAALTEVANLGAKAEEIAANATSVQ